MGWTDDRDRGHDEVLVPACPGHGVCQPDRPHRETRLLPQVICGVLPTAGSLSRAITSPILACDRPCDNRCYSTIRLAVLGQVRLRTGPSAYGNTPSTQQALSVCAHETGRYMRHYIAVTPEDT